MITYYKSLLIKLFSIVQLICTDPFTHLSEYLAIQEILITKISYIEERIRTTKSTIKDYKKTLGSKTSQIGKEDAQKIKEHITSAHTRIDGYRELLTTIRWIGDALAFSLIDSWDIKPMTIHKEKAGFISGKKGARRERQILRELFNHGYIAILTDLTNCLRYGDIAIFSTQGQYDLIEVKSSDTRSRRVSRQINNIGKIMNYLRTDYADDLFGKEGKVQRIQAHATTIRNIAQLNKVIDAALVCENSFDEVEEGLFYIATTHFDQEIIREIRERCKGQAIAASVDPNVYGNLAYFPLPLLIHNPEALFMVCTGYLSIVTVVDMGVIRDKLTANEISVNLSGENDDFVLLAKKFQPNDELIEMKIGHHLFSRIFAEFLSLEWFIDHITTSIQRYETASG